MKQCKLLVWICSFCCLVSGIQAQSHTLELRFADATELPDGLNFKEDHRQAKSVQNEVRKLRNELLALGYLTVSVDSLIQDSLTHTAYFFIGEKWEWSRLSKGNMDEGILSATGFREKVYQNKPIRPAAISRLMESTLVWCENHGYPFASIGLDSISMNNGTVDAVLHLQKNNLIIIDSVHIKGNAKIHGRYITNYLGLRTGEVWNESRFQAIRNRLREIPFLREIKPAEVVFSKDKAQIFLYLENKKANVLNGIVGVLSNDDGRVSITGELRVKLRNSFGRGELFDFEWRKLQSLTQNLNMELDYPYLFNSPFGVNLGLKLFQKDSTFIQVKQHLGLSYLLSGTDYVQAYVERHTSNLVDQSVIFQYNSLPPFADVNTTAYGLAFKKSKLDYALNPTKGFSLFADGKAGFKNIRKNDSLDILVPGIYDDITLKSTQYNVELDARNFFPVGKRNTVMLGFQGGYMLNPNLFVNEMFRIGGIHTLRGFDEVSINASTYGIASFEYRFLFEQNSNMYVFFDQAYYERMQTEDFFADRPFGFGAGISFETKAGIFSVNYALGSQQGNPIVFRSAKIHFGFVNVL